MEGEEEEKFLTTLNTDVRMKRTKKKKKKEGREKTRGRKMNLQVSYSDERLRE